MRAALVLAAIELLAFLAVMSGVVTADDLAIVVITGAAWWLIGDVRKVECVINVPIAPRYEIVRREMLARCVPHRRPIPLDPYETVPVTPEQIVAQAEREDAGRPDGVSETRWSDYNRRFNELLRGA